MDWYLHSCGPPDCCCGSNRRRSVGDLQYLHPSKCLGIGLWAKWLYGRIVDGQAPHLGWSSSPLGEPFFRITQLPRVSRQRRSDSTRILDAPLTSEALSLTPRPPASAAFLSMYK